MVAIANIQNLIARMVFILIVESVRNLLKRVAGFIVELNDNPKKYGQIKTQKAKQLELF